MKVFPIYDAKALPTNPKRKNLLGLSRVDKKALDRFLVDRGVSPKSWLLDGWLSTRVKRVATLRGALYLAEWAQCRMGFDPHQVLVALAKYEGTTPAPQYQAAGCDGREELRTALSPHRTLALDDDEDFEKLLDLLTGEKHD